MATAITIGPKQPLEKLDYSIDFVRVLDGASLSSIVSYVAYTNDEDQTVTADFVGSSPAPAISGTEVVIWFVGGEDGTDYLVQLVVDDSAGRRHAVNLVVQVRA